MEESGYLERALTGDEEEISATMKHMNKLFGGGCKLYHGVDSCGVVSLDEELT